MASSSRTAASSSSLAAIALIVASWSASASATNGSKPIVPASFPAAECLTTITRSAEPTAHFELGIPFEDVGTTPDEVPGSRSLQFFATCHDQLATRKLPTWISQTDVDAAAVVDPSFEPPTSADILADAPEWNGPGHDGDGSPCVVPINADDERLAITCEATEPGLAWDATDAPAGAYVIWGYTYEGARSSWSRRPGVVRVVDDDPDAAPPAVAFSSPTAVGEMGLDSGLMIEGCAAGAPGTTLTLSWATYAELAADPLAPWIVFAELDASAFAVPFVPPAEALHGGLVFRAEVVDPQGRTFSAISSGYMVVVPGCEEPSGGRVGVADGCGVAAPEEIPPSVRADDCSAASDDTGEGPGVDVDSSSEGGSGHGEDSNAAGGAAMDASGCAFGASDDRSTGWFVLSMTWLFGRRLRRAGHA